MFDIVRLHIQGFISDNKICDGPTVTYKVEYLVVFGVLIAHDIIDLFIQFLFICFI